MNLTVGNTQISLLDLEPDVSKLTEAQSETYLLLLSLARIGGSPYSIDAVVRWLSLQSPAPFYCRLRHLEQKGFCHMNELCQPA